MASPRTYKTAFLADVILRYPGPVIATTKADLFKLTSAVRSFAGPVHVFNPQHIGGVPSTTDLRPGAWAARRGSVSEPGASLQVVCARPRTQQLFRLTGLDGPVPLARTVDGALESLAAARSAPR